MGLDSVPKGDWFCGDCKPEAADLIKLKSRDKGRTSIMDLTQQADSSQREKQMDTARPDISDLITPLTEGMFWVQNKAENARQLSPTRGMD